MLLQDSVLRGRSFACSHILLERPKYITVRKVEILKKSMCCHVQNRPLCVNLLKRADKT